MTLDSWLKIGSTKTGSKRKLLEDSENTENESPAKTKFTQAVNQDAFDWNKKDEPGKWHCSLCRAAKFDKPYAQGHDKPAKTTNHTRHSTCM